ncbi:hypothetical protein ACFL0Z_00345 [Patescibacteria group bacterium]
MIILESETNMQEKQFEHLEREEESIPTPEVSFDVDEGIMSYLVLREILHPERVRYDDSEAVDIINSYKANFSQDEDLIHSLRKIERETDIGVFRMFVLQAVDSKRRTSIKRKIKKEKGHLKNPLSYLEEFNSLYEEYSDKSSDLIKKIRPLFEKDAKERKQSQQEQYQSEIGKIVDFYVPKKDTSKIEKVVYVATAGMMSGEGVSINLDKTGLIAGCVNFDGDRHEFVHFIIDPIVEGMDFTDQELNLIDEMTPELMHQRYGIPLAHLGETLNNAYVNYFSKGETQYGSYKKQVLSLGEDGFQREMKALDLKKVLAQFKINTYQEWLENLDEVYQNAFKSELVDRSIKLYEDYSKYESLNPDSHFEDFFLKNYKDLLN